MLKHYPRLPPLLPCDAGKLATDLVGGWLFISDSSNNRLVITDLEGRFLEAVGCGAPGLADGSYAEAAFHRPQGVAYSAKVCEGWVGGRRRLSTKESPPRAASSLH